MPEEQLWEVGAETLCPEVSAARRLWLGGVSLQPQLPLRDMPLVLLQVDIGVLFWVGKWLWRSVFAFMCGYLHGASWWLLWLRWVTSTSDRLRHFSISSAVSTINPHHWLLLLKLQVIGETAQYSWKKLKLYNLPLENLENKYIDLSGRGWGKSNIVLISLKNKKYNCRDSKRDVKMQKR